MKQKLIVRGVELHLHDAGGGRPLLMLDSGFSFQHGFLARLERNFHVIAPSHPGFDGAPRPDEIDSVGDLAYLYLDLIKQLDLRDVTLAGCSLGGWIAAEIAIKCTDRISGLVLVDSLGVKVSGRETPDIADIFAIYEDQLMSLLFHEPARFTIDMKSLSERQLAIVAENRAAMALYIWEPYAHNPKLLGRLGRIDVPALVIWGENDGLVSAGYGMRLAAAIPRARFESIPRCGHLPQVEQPEALLRHITAFTGSL